MAEKVKRCAIYTRKSTEDGLEQEYNSLDAQRDAATAFIRSQKHEGWKPIKETYDDGGISGGHMDRPGLQRLLADIRGRKIDVVVVYKVDRLSRSLADFAQLMKLFDLHDVSFVSVTQQFNTSSSMGRLTLNVLLSFAQFEREVTGERIRDKIALSKQKGMWMGGIPPLGYDVRERKLLINPTEAETVRTCFQTYLEKSGLIESVLELNQLNLTTKAFTSLKGRVQLPRPWVAKELHRLLTNPIYRGLIRHKGNEYPGEHEAIIASDVWNSVQSKLRQQQSDFRRTAGHLNETAIAKTRLVHPLKGFLFGIDGQALTPTYTNKSEKAANGTKTRKRYRYYVSQQAIRQGYGTSPLKTISAPLLEDAVRRMLIHALSDLAGFSSSEKLSTDEVRHRLGMHARHLARLDTPVELGTWLSNATPRIVVVTDMVAIHIPQDRLTMLAESLPEGGAESDSLLDGIPAAVTCENGQVILTATISFKSRRGRSEIIDGRTGEEIGVRHTAPNRALIQTIAQAEFWRSELALHPEKTLQEITEGYGVKPTYIRRLLNAAYLAPAIKKSIFQGTQPARLQVQDLLTQRSLDWRTQMLDLGFDDSVAA
ncbi:recombinase family protein [Luteolibacter flavescens]|uniref:Recombinase family protein n=1 Tax=Luteolibacter flavescens TaxID=1859460 RepID=A0ABT3FHS0_9BACT|nr:recombinase family protein [Luteolibacter flavescens]MCW1883111.1 recombinase family protein [Luteolibacter flavescens]